MIEYGFPAGFWLAAAAGGVVLAHVVRRRARRVEVPFLPLWQQVVSRRRAGIGSSFTRYLDLLLVLLACGAVALAASAPYVPGEPPTVRDLVLVIDGGVALGAGDRAERLRKVAVAELSRRVRGTRMTIIAVGDHGDRVWTGTDWGAARDRIEEHRPGWTDPSPQRALELGRSAADGLRDPDLVFCTYRPTAAEGYRLRTIALEAPNAGIAAMEIVDSSEGAGRIARLLLRGQGEVAVGDHWWGWVEGRREIDIALPADGEVELRARAAGDLFAADDAVYIVLPERKLPNVLVVAEGDPSPFLTAALQALEKTGVIRGPLDRATPDRALEAERAYDLMIFDRCVPKRHPKRLRAIYLAPPPPPSPLPFKVGEEEDAPVLFRTGGDHPLLQGFDLTRIPPRRARAILGGEPIASASPGPILALAPNWIALGFDPDKCILAASPAYPLLLRNCIAHLAQTVRVDKPEFHAINDPAPIEGVAELPGGLRADVEERLLGPPGFWRFREETLGVSLLLPELDLRAADQQSDPLPPVGDPGTPDEPLTAHASALALLMLLVAWWVFWRG